MKGIGNHTVFVLINKQRQTYFAAMKMNELIADLENSNLEFINVTNQ